MPRADDDAKAAEVKLRQGALAAKGMLIETWNLDDIGADLAWCGRDGSPTKVHRIQSVVLAGGEYREFPPTDDGLTRLVGELIEDHTIG
jgi:electron transfer flavoprotein beta subunit